MNKYYFSVVVNLSNLDTLLNEIEYYASGRYSLMALQPLNESNILVVVCCDITVNFDKEQIVEKLGI